MHAQANGGTPECGGLGDVHLRRVLRAHRAGHDLSRALRAGLQRRIGEGGMMCALDRRGMDEIEGTLR